MPTIKNTEQPSQQLPDAFSLFKPSWEAFRLNISAFVMQFLFPVGLVLLTVLFISWATHTTSVAADVAAIVSGVLAAVSALVITASLIVTELHSAKNQQVSFEHAFYESLHYLPRLVGLFLLNALIILIGFVLLIVPGVFAIQRLLLAPYLLVDKNLGIRQAIRESFAISKKHSSAVWGVVGIMIAINLIGIIPIVGWVASAVLSIMYLCAPAIRYLQIKHS